MELFLIFVVAPVLVYLAMVALPGGTGFRILALLLVALLLAGWGSFLAGIGPLGTGQGDAEGFLLVALVFVSVAAFGGLAVRAAGRRLAGGPGWRYPMLATVVFLAAAVPAVTMLGL
jgi:hypothetical protein